MFNCFKQLKGNNKLGDSTLTLTLRTPKNNATFRMHLNTVER